MNDKQHDGWQAEAEGLLNALLDIALIRFAYVIESVNYIARSGEPAVIAMKNGPAYQITIKKL